MPDAATQTDENLQPTRRPLSESSKKKYDQAIARLKTAGYDIENQPREVIEWVNQKIENSEEGSSEMVSFKDKENRNSVLFMDLLEAMKVGVDCFGFSPFLTKFNENCLLISS